MPWSTVSTRITPSGFGASTSTVISAIHDMYVKSSLLSQAIDSWLASNSANILIDYSPNTAGAISAVGGSGHILIDTAFFNQNYYISTTGKAVLDTFASGLAHELGHALTGYTDNESFADLAGDNVRLVNPWYQQLGFAPQASYEAYDQNDHVLIPNYDYTHGELISNAIIDKGSYHSFDNSLSFNSSNIDLNAVGVHGATLIVGGNASNLYGGTDDGDWIYGGGGTDTLSGGNGNDHLYGGIGSDSVMGGAGNDVLAGAADPAVPGSVGSSDTSGDNLNGDAGNDSLYGGAGNDSLFGGDGNDWHQGGAGNDDIDGGSGNNILYGEAGNDTLTGGNGNDVLSGDASPTYSGVGGSDRLEGGDGDDRLFGNDGNDTLLPGRGPGYVEAGNGDDMIRVDGYGTFYGNAGDDLFSIASTTTSAASKTYLVGGDGTDKFYFEVRSDWKSADDPGGFREFHLFDTGTSDQVYWNGYRIGDFHAYFHSGDNSWDYADSNGFIFFPRNTVTFDSGLEIRAPDMTVIAIDDWKNGDMGITFSGPTVNQLYDYYWSHNNTQMPGVPSLDGEYNYNPIGLHTLATPGSSQPPEFWI